MAGDDELRTVVSSPTFDEMLAEREREAGGGDDIETAKTAMALSYDERLAQMEAARAAGGDAGASGERATIPQPEARPDPFAPPPAPARDPFAPALGPPPFAGAPPAAPPTGAAPVAPAQEGVLPKTVMLSASDWQIPSAPGGPGAPGMPSAPYGSPASAPGMPAAPYAPPGAAPAPRPPAAAPAKKGLSPLVLFGIGLGATFVVGSCIAAAAIVWLVR